eukprot:CAMPEP_0168853708 /NCGR_PEP_ID=MMETSP0727-20121128/13673_1 /TAXON_ID=265536 /ORGANISM="Amphiprora sp., Strain CCMP467" /LENGTH=83 /DNA_ID=CAMNT_0008907953 /DNA_START=28 /DNA_END=279 /DNA_ORIENTATION=-
MTIKKEEEQDVVVPMAVEPIATATPSNTVMAYAEPPTKQDEQQQQSGPPVPPGHARFYCSKCRTVRNMGHLDVRMINCTIKLA